MRCGDSMARDVNKSARNDLMKYRLERKGTEKGVGWFACIPEREVDFESGLEYSRAHPNDQFMHKHLLDTSAKLTPEEIEWLIQKGDKVGDFHLLALMYEACILHVQFQKLKNAFEADCIDELAQYSPFIYIRWSLEKNAERNFYWLQRFSRNANLLEALPWPEEAEHPMPFDLKAIHQWEGSVVPIREIASLNRRPKKISKRPAPKEAAKEATKKLERLGILTGWETRPDATLSPYAVERPWNLNVTVKNGANHWQLTGTQTSYGRGLNIHQGRISCVMEAAERYSAFASIDSGRAIGYKKDHRIIRSTYEEISGRGENVLNPHDLCLEVPYRNQELHWVMGEQVGENGSLPIYVPAQLVFLFSNLDEISLNSGLPSNGFAAGNTLEGAKLGGLLEVIERDAERVVPYSDDRCFLMEATDPKVKDMLESCKQKGIQIRFLDITPEFDVPCYRAFIQGPGGVILKGTGAHLDGKMAALAAMTEIPYPYPYWFGSMTVPDGMNTIEYEDLPDYSTGDPEKDLLLLEKLLIMNGYRPIYVDLTREDIDIPVVRTLIPGLEIMTLLDRFSPLSVRQFGHYLKNCR
jgi:ribosomal protein S12 methylthiotransferase accessory factor YcaO